MSFWQWLTGAGATPNSTVENPDSVGPTYRPGEDQSPLPREVGLFASIPPWDKGAQ